LSRLLSEIESVRWTTNVVFVFIILFDIIVFICTRSNRENNRNVEFSNTRFLAIAEIFFIFICVSILRFVNFISCYQFFVLEERSRDFIISDSWTLKNESRILVAEEMILSNLNKIKFLKKEESNLIFNENERF
jgi:heme/copper-type cytochrome/quinol oxidase subunit 2